jgi:hypothetical protein
MLNTIPFAVLEKAFIYSSRGPRECSLIEFHTNDFNKLTEIHNMVSDAGFALGDRFLFRNSLVLRNNSVEEVTIST